jgi:peptidoglycan hydrolase CwlO-like protein
MKQQITILTKKYENLLNKVQDLENTTDYLEERVSEQQNKITNNDYNIRHKMEDLVNTNYVFIE